MVKVIWWWHCKKNGTEVFAKGPVQPFLKMSCLKMQETVWENIADAKKYDSTEICFFPLDTWQPNTLRSPSIATPVPHPRFCLYYLTKSEADWIQDLARKYPFHYEHIWPLQQSSSFRITVKITQMGTNTQFSSSETTIITQSLEDLIK